MANRDLGAQQESINRRRQMAQALQQSAILPLQSQRPDVPIHATQGLSKLAEALFAGLINRKLDKQQSALDTEREAEAREFLGSMVSQPQGMQVGMAPTQAAALPALGGGYESAPQSVAPEGTRTLPVLPGQVDTRNSLVGALASGMISRDPMQQRFSEMGLQDVLGQQREGRADSREMARILQQQKFQSGERQAGQQYNTSERLAGQQFTTGRDIAQHATQIKIAEMRPQQDQTPEERFISLQLRDAAQKAGGTLSTQQETEVRKNARKEWTELGRENDPRTDALALQLKELQIQQAEQRLADAKRAAGSGELSPKQLGSVLSLSNSLKSHPAYTDMLDIHGGILGVEAGLKQKNGFGDITAINAFQRMVDPGATVRSEDVVLLQSGSSFLQKILSDYPIEKLKTGAKLPDEVREQMRTVAKQLYEARGRNYNDTVGNQYKALAAAGGFPFEYVGQDFKVDTPSTSGWSVKVKQ